MHNLKFFIGFAVLALMSLLGATQAARADSGSTTPHYASIEDLMPQGSIAMQCEGEVREIQNTITGLEKTTRSVTCDDVHLHLTFSTSLVGYPSKGYAAYVDLVSPRGALSYSLWTYADPSQATVAGQQWRANFRALARGDYEVTDQSDTFVMKGKDEFGLPWWGRVVQQGNRLVVIEVDAFPAVSNPPTSSADMERWLGNLKPENEVATQVFFEATSRAIESKFFGTR